MNVIIIPFHDYKKWRTEGFRTRDSHFYQHFIKNNSIDKILIVNRPTSLPERLFKSQNWKEDSDQTEYNKNGICLTKINDNSWCIDFDLVDVFKVITQRKTWWDTAFRYNKVINAINDAIIYLNMDNAVLLLQNPMAVGVIGSVKYKKFVFDAIDNWLYHPQMKNKEKIQNNYEFIDKHADMIMTVSEALKNTFVNNKNVVWVPNGVDVDYFKAAIKKKKNSEQPLIGYVGKIQERVDFDLVEECLRQLPNCKFKFLGPIYSQKKKIKELEKKYSNIEFTGDINYTQLPLALKEFDIAIIPHIINNFTSSMNPLKLYEYLSAGKPVVTTGVAGTKEISKYVYLAQNKNEFITKLKMVVHNEEIINEAAEIVGSIPKMYFWSNISDRVINLLENL